uniref:Uncharacterized protein n=1 Tax=viral metagenome TaxID=1070528 RepID=A0A6C0JSB1_9ZZZZ
MRFFSFGTPKEKVENEKINKNCEIEKIEREKIRQRHYEQLDEKRFEKEKLKRIRFNKKKREEYDRHQAYARIKYFEEQEYERNKILLHNKIMRGMNRNICSNCGSIL